MPDRSGAFLSILAAVCLALPAAAAHGAPRERIDVYARGDSLLEPSTLFYHGRDYGSETLIHPLRMFVNGSYGILQLANQDRRIWKRDYALAIENVWLNVRDPFEAIRETEGWKDFLFREILPFSTNTRDARYWPNYTQHLIGGGMSYRMIAEWYGLKGFEHPRLWSAGTMAIYHLWNEVVENADLEGYTTDPVADLYIFDPLGMVLFNHDGVAGFFARTLHMRDWSYQPAYDPRRETLENNGQNFSIKYALPWTDRWSLFYYYGTHAEMGLSRTWPDGRSVSFAGGFRAGRLEELGKGVRTVDLVPTFGLFYDREGSLLASLLLSNIDDYSVRLNLYPGLLGRRLLEPGIFLATGEGGIVFAGITFGALSALPVGVGTRLAGDDSLVEP